MSAEDKPKRPGPGRPPLPPGVKPSEGQTLVQFRCAPSLAAYIHHQGGAPFLRALAESDMQKQPAGIQHSPYPAGGASRPEEPEDADAASRRSQGTSELASESAATLDETARLSSSVGDKGHGIQKEEPHGSK